MSDERTDGGASFRAAIRAAEDQARRDSAPVIGTEHLLLGALRQEDDAAVRLLGQHGITWAAALTRYEELFGSAYAALRPRRASEALMRFSPRAQEALQKARSEAAGQPGVAHLLVALLENEGVGLGILHSLAVGQGRLPYDGRELADQIRALREREGGAERHVHATIALREPCHQGEPAAERTGPADKARWPTPPLGCADLEPRRQHARLP